MQQLPLSDNDAFNLLKRDILSTFNCHRIGIIQSFNSSNQTASVSIVDKIVRIVNDLTNPLNPNSTYQYFDFPLLQDCPVIINAGQAGGITIPITIGDTCLVHFNDRDIDLWFSNGQIQPPNTSRMHDFSDAIVEIGIRNKLNFLQNYNNAAIELFYGTTKISLDTKIGITNESQDFKTLFDSFIDTIKSTVDILIGTLESLTVIDPISGPLPIDSTTSNALTILKSNTDIALTILKSNIDQLLK